MIRISHSVFAACLLAGFSMFAGCAEEPAPKVNTQGQAESPAASSTPASDAPTGDASSTQSTQTAANAAAAAAATNPAASNAMPASKLKADVKISTNLGDITVALYDDTPKHKANMLKLAKQGYYDGTLFHRVIPTFMIQGGDPDSKDPNRPAGSLGMGGPGYQVPAEILRNHFHKRGALAAARTGDGVNPKRESSGSQFYIVHGVLQTDDQLNAVEQQISMFGGVKDFKFTAEERAYYKQYGGTPSLDQQYTVFGEVVTGMDVVDKIATVQQGPNNQPAKPVTMKVTVIE